MLTICKNQIIVLNTTIITNRSLKSGGDWFIQELAVLTLFEKTKVVLKQGFLQYTDITTVKTETFVVLYKVVAAFPSCESLLRLIGSILST
ncbi:MAG: hypothetical protein Q7V05_12170, partial [Methanoregula sp.]|nr:hypothetical protein [Methanoregula sp.]